MPYEYPQVIYVDQWVLRVDGTLDAKFVDSSMRIVTSPIISLMQDCGVVITENGLPYILKQPYYQDFWPANVPANKITDVLHAVIIEYERNMFGDSLWVRFQDALADMFATYSHFNGR